MVVDGVLMLVDGVLVGVGRRRLVGTKTNVDTENLPENRLLSPPGVPPRSSWVQLTKRAAYMIDIGAAD
ncbi:unnamed protein product [Gongylonema pulchrum]|uniref:Uncharacterized protein n=1 Tax=Gongylonema pulchrum TaxID=637853 RepID=A0A183E9D7_9BILA|nr:unnamed protein product [Gongylonema pulchrum]